MKDIKVVFTGAKKVEDGTEQTSFTAVPSGCTVSRAVCSTELQHQASTAALEFPYDPDLFQFLFSSGGGDSQGVGRLSAVIKNGDEVVFTGRVSTKLSWTDLGEPYPVEKLSLSLSDDTEKFNISATSELGWISTKISTILIALCKKADVSCPSLSEQNAPGKEQVTLIIDEGKNLKSVLDGFLFQNGYSYYFDEDNNFRLYSIPSSKPSATNALGEADIIGSPTVAQQDRDYTGVKVTYNLLTKKSNEQVYFQGGGYMSDNTTAPIVLQKDVYYPFESAPVIEAEEGQVYQTFETGYAESKKKYNGEITYQRTTKASLLYTENHKVMPEWDGEIEADRSEFGFRRASVRLVNKGEADANLYALAIRADAWYADTECSMTVGEDGNMYTAECEYIHSSSVAKSFATMLSKYFVSPCYKMTAQSEKKLEMGTFATFSTGLSGFTKVALIISAGYDFARELWTYTLVGYDGAATLNLSRFKSHASNVPILSEIAAVKQQVATLPGADKTPPSVPVMVSLTGDDYGNATLVFSPSIDTGSGMSHYNIYRTIEPQTIYQISGTVSHDPKTVQYAWEDVTNYKNKKYSYKVTAVDKSGNESSASASASFVSTVKINPRPPENVVAEAAQTAIHLTWQSYQSNDAALQASYHAIEISRDGGKTWTELYNARERYDYWFDRETDGYPEKPELEKWRFRLRAVSVYGNTSDYVETDVDLKNYKTWKITGLSVDECRATEKLITLAWSVASDFYGLLKFDLYRNGEKVLDGASTQVYRELLKGYPEKDFFSGITYRLVARTEADEAEADGITVDTSEYLTYKVSAPKVSASADESGWHIEWSGKAEPYYLHPVYDVYINGEKVAEGLSLLSLDAPYLKDNPYPMLADVSAAEIKVVARTDADSAESEEAEKSLAGFRGWLPPVPKLYISAASRTVPLSWNRPDIWGFTGCDVQVAKAYKVVGGKYAAITDDSELEWYAPALGRNPYESEEAYRTGEEGGYLNVAGTSVAFTVPLYGQADGATPTMYAYRVRGVSVGARGDWSEAHYVECRPTSAYDVVRAWDLDDNGEKVKIDGALGVKQIFVEELSALSANLGVITDGGLVGSRYNYWAVNDTPMEDGSVLPKGSFRVGGSDQYILVEPRLNAEGVATGEYDITFNVGSLQISASGTRIDGQTFEVYDADGNLMFSVSPEGGRIRVAEGEYTSSYYSAQVPGNILYDALYFSIYAWKYKGDVYFTAYKDTERKSSVLYRLKGDSPSKAEAVLEIPFLTPYGLMNNAGLDGGETVYAIGQDTERYKCHLLEISLEAAAYHAHPIDGDLDDSIKDEDGNYWYQNVIEVLHGRIWVCMSDHSNNTARLAYYDMSGSRHDVCELSSSDIVRACEYNGDVYFAIAGVYVTMFLRVSAIDDSVAFGGVPAVYLWDNVIENAGRFFRVKDGAIEMAGALDLIIDINADGSINYIHDKFSFYKIPLEKIRWSESEENVGFSTDGEAWISSVPIPQDAAGRCWAFNAYCDGIVATDFYFDNEKDSLSECSIAVLKRDDFGEPEYHGAITIRGSLAVERTLEGMTAGIDFSSQYSIYSAMALLSGLCLPVSVAGTPAVLAPLFIMSADFEQSQSSRLVMRTALYEQKVDITGGNVYAAGIGFNAIYHDKRNGRRRYYLDTGAWLEFGEDGRLIAQGEQGLPGATGSQGPKGDTGETPSISATATVDGNAGEPEVKVKKTGTAENPVLEFEFKNLKGDKGDAGKDGERGKQGEQGVSIASIEQTEGSTEDGGPNVFTVTKSDGTSAGSFTVRNGSRGEKGDPGELSAENTSEADISDANHAVGLSASGSVTKTLWSKVWSWIKGKIEAAALTVASRWVFKGGITAHAPIQYYDGSITTSPVQVEKGTATDGSLCKFAGSNGMTALASGEAYNNPLARFKSKFNKTNNSEELVLLSDNGIFFAVNCQSTTATADGNMKVFQMDTSGNMSLPGALTASGRINANGGIKIPASAPSAMEDGMIWIS